MTRLAPMIINGRYELHEQLGRGGMAEVYLGHDHQLDRAVAVKVLFPALATDPDVAERFRHEVQAATALDHPNIARVEDWGEANGTYFLVTEYVEGETLGELVAHEGRLHADRAAEIAADIASALDFAHRQVGVLHRNLTPGNVLVRHDGVVKVTDFAIAGALDAGAGAGSGSGGARPSDVHDLGGVLYEMVVGQPAGAMPVAPRRVDPAIPGTLEAIVLKSVAKNPANRYPSAHDMAADLRRYLDGARIGGGAPLAPVPPPGPVQPGPVPVPPPSPPAVDDPDATAVMSTIDDTVLAGIADRTTTLVPTAAHAADDDGHHSGRHYAGHDDHDDEDGSQEGLRSYAIVAALVVVLLVLVGMLFLVSGLRGSDGGGETAADSGDIAVPRVVGMPQADAQAALAQVDLVAAVETVADDSAPAGTVIDQNPGADETLAAGSSVTLTVSSGPEALTVPDLAGRTQDEAAQIVTDMGLLPSPTQVESQTVPEGMVIGTNPAAGTPTTRGTTIEIQVSARPSATGVPDVTGQPEAQARATLEAAGFQVTVTDQPTRRRRRDGMVLGQNPAGGTPVQIGSPVEIVVGRADGRDDDWPFDFDFDNNG